jgi:hypothetical protein
MEDKRSYIEFTQSRAKAIRGRELTPAELAADFAKVEFAQRIEVLDALDRDAKSGDAYRDAREASRRYVYEHLLRETHKKLAAIQR